MKAFIIYIPPGTGAWKATTYETAAQAEAAFVKLNALIKHLIKRPEDLEPLPMDTLVACYNTLAQHAISRFQDRKVGAVRLFSFLGSTGDAGEKELDKLGIVLEKGNVPRGEETPKEARGTTVVKPPAGKRVRLPPDATITVLVNENP